MAFEPGGYADKMGNRYEGRWICRQLLLLLGEHIRAVTLEATGPDEFGIDLWIDRNDGFREAQQCKAENSTKAQWTLSDLKQRGVIDKLRFQLEREPSHRYAFISGVPATQLRDLVRSAHDSSGDSEHFYQFQILLGSKERSSAFADWCRHLGFNQASPSDRKSAFNFLQRTDCHLFSDDANGREDLRLLARLIVVGDPEITIDLLASYAADNPRKVIVAQDVWRHLGKAGQSPRTLNTEDRVVPLLNELNDEFVNSIQPHLAGGRVIPRKEVDELIGALSSDVHHDAVILHGPAGQGKSGILYQVTQKLRDLGTPFLALRLDRKTPVGSPRQFGISIGLPESPVKCLDAVSHRRSAVVILDQLDALRWTSAHATEGLDVCKGILREVQTLRGLGRKIAIIFSCRTFDLEHDPQLRDWLKSSDRLKVVKLSVSELSEKATKDFVRQFGVEFDLMSTRQRSLLRSVHNLAIWASIVSSERNSPGFDTGTELMRRFWQNRRREIEKAGCSPIARDDFLNRLVDYMESQASLSAPRRIIGNDEKMSSELQTLNVIHIEGHRVSFCHQSYLDFLIADRVLNNVLTRRSDITGWLGERGRQTLFRREQLRQAFFLLADEAPQELDSAIDSLLESDDVRFHIKQLLLESLSQISPGPTTVDRVVDLISNPKWRDHVLRDVVVGRNVWVRALHNLGLLVKRLHSDDEIDQNTSIWLLHSVAHDSHDIVSAACDSFAQLEQAVPLLKGVFHYSKPESEFDNVFELRLKCVRASQDPPYVAWKALAVSRPERAIRLLAEYLEGWPDSKGQPRRHSLNIEGSEDYKKLIEAARRRPMTVWRHVLSLVVKLHRSRRKNKAKWRANQETDLSLTHPFTKIPRILFVLTKAAAVAIVRADSARFERLASKLNRIRSRAIRAIVLHAWSNADRKDADAAINWLLEDERRIRCGSERRKPRWHQASLLIRRMSPSCSHEVFAKLERTLLRYTDPRERRLAERWLQRTRDGNFNNFFLAAQHFLLPALCPKRRSIESTGRIGVLQRKFASYANESFIQHRGQGGAVHSSLSKYADMMSDKQWLRLMKQSVQFERNPHRREARYFPDHVVESSVRMFARDFGAAAEREPERFARLAAKMPPDVPAEFVTELFGALQNLRPPSGLTETEREAWSPAPKNIVEHFLEQIDFTDEAEQPRRFLWLIRGRGDLDLTDRALSRLIELAEHPNPEPGYVVSGDDGDEFEMTASVLEVNAINCVRSLAAINIGIVLFNDSKSFPRFASVLERLLQDPHPAVRIAMVEVCVTLWSFDQTLAIEWFLMIVGEDLRLACGDSARRLFNMALPEFSEHLCPLIEKLCASSIADVRSEGAAEVTARWLFFEFFPDQIGQCLNGTEAHRLGVATVVGDCVRQEKYSIKCQPLMLKLCDDESLEVRQKVSHSVYDVRILKVPGSVEFLRSFLHTRGFADEPSSLLRALEDYDGSLAEFSQLIFEMIERLIQIMNTPDLKRTRGHPLLETHLSAVLLRLYEQAGPVNTQTKERCLDMFDQLLENRLAPARTLIDEIKT